MCSRHWMNGWWKGQPQLYGLYESNKNAEGKKLESFNQFYNYSSLRVWRCYGIGNGKFAPYKS